MNGNIIPDEHERQMFYTLKYLSRIIIPIMPSEIPKNDHVSIEIVNEL